MSQLAPDYKLGGLAEDPNPITLREAILMAGAGLFLLLSILAFVCYLLTFHPEPRTCTPAAYLSQPNRP